MIINKDNTLFKAGTMEWLSGDIREAEYEMNEVFGDENILVIDRKNTVYKPLNEDV